MVRLLLKGLPAANRRNQASVGIGESSLSSLPTFKRISWSSSSMTVITSFCRRNNFCVKLKRGNTVETCYFFSSKIRFLRSDSRRASFSDGRCVRHIISKIFQRSDRFDLGNYAAIQRAFGIICIAIE